jgi:hypothetical protein
MSVYKRGNVYWYKFTRDGHLIRESTEQGDKKRAERMEKAHKEALAVGFSVAKQGKLRTEEKILGILKQIARKEKDR